MARRTRERLGSHRGTLLAAFAAAGVCTLAFVPSASHSGRRAGQGCARQASGTAEEPWKPLVFKMPKKKPERQLPPGDDGYSKRMRERLRSLKLQTGDVTEQRSVSETKADDLVSVEAENAKISGLNAMWYMDRITDQAIAEEQNPDKAVLRKKYEGALRRLEAEPEVEERREEADTNHRGGFLNPAGVQDMDDLIANARSAAALHETSKAKGDSVARTSAGASQHEEEQEESIVQYLEEVQERSKMQDKVSRRVVKSIADRKQEYEASKGNILAATGGLGLVGTAAAANLYGVDEAFSFFLGSIGALSYLSGLSDYADNAESPIGTAMGGRRLLVPVILVLLITQWYKIEALVPAVAELHLSPQVLPALLGFFMYSVGKVVGGAISNRFS